MIIALLPLVGRMLTRTDPRPMMAFGLVLLAAAMFYMAHFDLELGFGDVVFARLVQGCGMAFLWVPINTVAYSYLPRDKNNAASGLINLARNVGASMGISYVTTMLDRRAQSHQNFLVAHLDPGNPRLQQMLQGTTATLQAQGGSNAMQQAYGLLQLTFSVRRRCFPTSIIFVFSQLSACV